MRYFIYLSYDGAGYHGWQVQPNGNSIQAELNRALSIYTAQNIETIGAGRTDAGVNARLMVAHFDIDTELDVMTTTNRMNRILPQSIAVHKLVRVRDDAHARFSAISRTYQYYIHTDRDPFNRQYSFRVTYPLDFEKMNIAAKKLFNYTDFTSFSKLHTDTKTNDCKIMKAEWVDGCFTIKADRFLRNMVRAIVGTLLDVGRGQISVEEFCKIVEQKNRCSAGMSVPGNALFLTDIEYDDEIFSIHNLK
ncbi:MAG: tRNA pseudouridine(38-40) synthase TruA [Prevotellaceae bacterium]|nr:tRNA pseudouridine(38-40) synthase TruA [Candidatus Colivivens equi]MCQ2078046.1 tRNA pseudouridine(38-40) synthase TruA [Bacteroidaceae bacterium]